MPEPPPLGDPVDSDPTPSQPPHPKVWEEVKEVQVTPDTVTTREDLSMADGFGFDGGVGFLFFLVESWQSSSFDMSAVFRFSQGNGAIFRLCREFLICSWRQNNPAVSELLFWFAAGATAWQRVLNF